MSAFEFSPRLEALAEAAEASCAEAFRRIDRICERNTRRVLEAFQACRVSESHLQGSSGYGYGDRGRDALDQVFAHAVGAEDALVRHHFVSGTAAIATALFGLLRPGDVMVSLTGTPYDTIQPVLGLREGGHGSLKEFGVVYRELPLLPDGTVDRAGIPAAVKGAKIAYIQRSRGYSLRPSLSVAQIGELAALVKEAEPRALLVVDNCYGEFVEEREPPMVGADIIAGSLIKNPGGGIARTGGYIAGKAEPLELCAHRMTVPGMGREVGCSLGENKNMFMGLFYAPAVVAAALRTAVLAARLLGDLGFQVLPLPDEDRADIIQTVVLKTPQALKAFCRGIQRGAPVDSFLVPEPWDMPGYESQVIMAAGAFNLGASIELSADGPMRPPYAAWMQGGLTYPSGKLGVLLALREMETEGLI